MTIKGRPRDPERMKRVLHTASEAFLEHGYHYTSIDNIAIDADVSKATIYSYFPDKGALFRVCMTSRIESMCSSFPKPTLDPKRPAEALSLVAKQLLLLVRSEDMLNIHRTLFSVAGTHTDVCASFIKAVPQRFLDWLGGYLTSACKVGSLQIEDIHLASDQFCSLFHGIQQTQILLGLGEPNLEEDAKLITENISLFQARYGTSNT